MKKFLLSLMLLLPMIATAEEVIFTIYEKMPEFPGGKQAMMQYLNENVKYPAIAQELSIEGKVICQFFIETDGSITDVHVVRSGGDPSLDKEAVRVFQSMPKWIPASHKGKLVRAQVTVPLTFKLSDSSSTTVNRVARPYIQEEYAAPKKKIGGFTDGDSLWVQPVPNAGGIRAQDGTVITLNQGYMATSYQLKTDFCGKIAIVDDTIFVTYKRVMKGSLLKKERYVYHKAPKGITLEGEQIYYCNNQPLCSEYISDGRLERTVWYGASGIKEYEYIYMGNDGFTEVQYYPSGETKIRTEHFGTPEAKQTAYDEAGNEVELTQPIFSSEQDLENGINDILFKGKVYTEGNYYVSVTTSPQASTVAVLLYDETTGMWKRMDGDLSYTPAMLDGKAVSLTKHMPYRYQLRQADIVAPAYPGGGKALLKYLYKNFDIRETVLFPFSQLQGYRIKGWMDIDVEVDETGKVLSMQQGQSDLKYSPYLGEVTMDAFKEQIVGCLRKNPERFIPGTVNGEPQPMRTTIRLDKLYFSK